MGILSYAALAARQRERRRHLSLQVALLVAVVTFLMFVKWEVAPSAAGAGPLGWLYGVVYLVALAGTLVAAAGLRWSRWTGLPLVLTLFLMAYGAALTWVDCHFTVDFLAFTIATFGLGVIYSTGPGGYALILGGTYGLLVLILGLTLPGRLVDGEILTHTIVLGLAFAGANLLERQRRTSDEMAVQLEDLNEHLRETSFRDPLTGLYNRRYLVEFLTAKRALALRVEMPLSVVLLDVDHFKKINDSLGHLVGDQTLQILAQALVGGIREMDLAARYGGEEFVLVLPQATVRDAAKLTVRILERVRKTSFPGVPWPVSFSAGVAGLEGDEPVESLLERADRKLYAAKKKRNMVVSW